MSRLVYGWLTALIAGIPLSIGYFLARALTEVHLRVFPDRRHAALANLTAAMPGSSRRERLGVVRRMMASYNCFLFEFFRLPHLDRDELMRSVEVVGRENLEAAVARGRGVILASTHIGNWELGAIVLAQSGYTIHAVAGQQLNRWLTPAVRQTKTEMAIHTIAIEDGFRKLLRALSRNEMVALMVDGDIYQHGTTVEFMGRETQFAAGPGVLAQRTGAQIICGYCERLKSGRFRIVLEPAIDPAAHASVGSVNTAVAACIEKHVLAHLDQWCIFRPLWDATTESAADPSGHARHSHA
jgi:KDO2-lipid IV(A) lauroyltransferase